MFKELLKDAFPIIEKAAPIIATALGTPVAGVGAKLALSLLGNAFDINPAFPQKISDAIVTNPKANDILSKLEEDFADWFINNNGTMKPPSRATVNITLEWNNAS